MKTKRSGLIVRAIFIALFALTAPARAADSSENPGKQIPKPLKAWEKWALWDDDQRACPTPYSNPNKRLCFWPSRMGLRVEKTGAQFDMVATVYSETWVPLPGGAEAWPHDVKADGAVVTVLDHAGAPAVHLAAGTFHLTGSYAWASVPQRIPIPREIGILALVIDGQPVDAPVWDAQGFLWLKRDGSTEETDRNFLSTKLYAELADGIPMWLHMQVELTVSGKSREEEIGYILPEGWKLASVEGPVPVLVDDAGKMKAQVRAGRWIVRVNAFRFDNPKEFHFAPATKAAVPEEFVAFSAQTFLRVLEIEGVPPVDVSQTTVPEEWRSLPVYRWDTGTPFQITERMRGMGQQKLEGLRIERELWLDENGREMTFRDRISGQRQQIWRLDAAEGQDLGSVRRGGQGQLITRNPDNSAPGVEIRSHDLDLEATGRAARTGNLPATGWRSDADAVSVTLNLPPGWRLFALFGADWVRGDWLTAWTLLDLFLLLIFSLAVLRMWGFGSAVLAFVAFGLSYHEAGAPRFLWLILLVPLAMQRVVPEGWGRRMVRIVKWIAIAALLLVFVPFVARQIQQALYPQLEVVGEERWSPFPRFNAQQSKYIEAAKEEALPMPATEPAASTETLRRKMERIIIPKLEFREATIREAIDFLKKESVDLDDQSPPGQKGVNIILKLEDSSGGNNVPTSPIPGVAGLDQTIPSTVGNPIDARITVSLTNIPLIEALRYVTGLANLKYKVEPYAVSVVPLSEPTDVLVTKEWSISPNAIPHTPSAGGTADVDRESVKNWLIANGVVFNGSAAAMYIVKNNRLIVRNTQDQIDLMDAIFASSAAPAGAVPLAAPAFRGSSVSRDNLAYDAKARIQTGPGVPEWKWRAVSFGWNGPVTASQTVRPILISLTLERLLTVLRVGLLLALAAVMLGARKLGGPAVRAGGKTAAILLFFGLVAQASAQPQIPDQSTIEKLRERLLKPSDAYPTAADIPSVSLTLNERKVTIDAEIHAAIRTAVPLPGKLPAWSPVTVLVDNNAEVRLRRDDGYLWIVVDAGVHHVHIEGSLANVTEWEWTYLLKPHQVKIDAPDWTFNGVKPSGIPDAQILFTRKQKVVADQASYDRQEVQTVAVVDRTLELGLIWQVRATVTRLSSPGKAVVLRIPLLPGENVLSSGAIVKDGFIEIRLGAQDRSFSWEGSIPVVQQLKLTTQATDTWVERWRLVTSPVWDVKLGGLPPTFEPGNADLVPAWYPWPGESAELTISRPEAIAGATVTVNKATYQVSLGKRQITARLDLSLRCSVGEDFLVELPAEADITSLTRNGPSIPVRKDGAKLVIPLDPGDETVSIGWKRNVALGFSAATDDVRLPVESANIETIITVPEDRWLLWAGGPQRGPAVRFWGILLCSLLAAGALSRIARSPLRALEWMLLVIGLTQVPLPAALVVVGWLFFLAWRGGEAFQRQRNGIYNTLQIVLVLLTVAALSILVSAVSEGLLGRPEMFVVGNGSTLTELHWFQARSESLLPRCECLSISIWWYRFFMLVWALWLAAALIRWLHRGWQSFSSGGIFRRKAKVQSTPPPLPVNP